MRWGEGKHMPGEQEWFNQRRTGYKNALLDQMPGDNELLDPPLGGTAVDPRAQQPVVGLPTLRGPNGETDMYVGSLPGGRSGIPVGSAPGIPPSADPPQGTAQDPATPEGPAKPDYSGWGKYGVKGID